VPCSAPPRPPTTISSSIQTDRTRRRRTAAQILCGHQVGRRPGFPACRCAFLGDGGCRHRALRGRHDRGKVGRHIGAEGLAEGFAVDVEVRSAHGSAAHVAGSGTAVDRDPEASAKAPCTSTTVGCAELRLMTFIPSSVKAAAAILDFPSALVQRTESLPGERASRRGDQWPAW
jgi:hypothetical protein